MIHISKTGVSLFMVWRSTGWALSNAVTQHWPLFYNNRPFPRQWPTLVWFVLSVFISVVFVMSIVRYYCLKILTVLIFLFLQVWDEMLATTSTAKLFDSSLINLPSVGKYDQTLLDRDIWIKSFKTYIFIIIYISKLFVTMFIMKVFFMF